MDRSKVEVRGVASRKTCRLGHTNFWFDHSTACNKLCVVGLSEKVFKCLVRLERTSHARNYQDIWKQLQSWTKDLRHLHFWDVFQFTQVQPLPSPRKQCWTSASWIFSEFQLCIGWGEGELQENFEKGALFYEGTEKWQKNMNNAVLPQRLLSMIEPVEKLATPPEVKMATFSCPTFAGNRERAEWAHIACWGSQSELSVPFILPSRGFSYVKTSVDWNILCDRTSEFFIRSNTKFRLLLEILHVETVYHQYLEVPISINTILIHFTKYIPCHVVLFTEELSSLQ